MTQKINVVGGTPRETLGVSCATIATSLEGLGLTVVVGTVEESNREKARFALVQVQTNAVRFGTGANVAPGYGTLLQPGDSVWLKGEKEVQKTLFANDVSSAKAGLFVTVEFE